MRTPSAVLLFSVLLAAACAAGPDETPDAAGNTDVSDAGGTIADAGGSTPDAGESTPDAGGTTPDAGSQPQGEFIGCTGPSGSCDGLTGPACQAGVQLGCTPGVSISGCAKRIYCIPGIDGCPFDYCETVAGNCQFKDAAKRAAQDACTTHTTYEACVAGDCMPQNPVAVCSGSWSCEISFAELDPQDRPEATSCANFQTVGFACEPVYHVYD